MDPLEYIGTAIEDWDVYLLLLAVSAVAHWFLLLRRRTVGFFDPLFFVLFGSAFGWAIVGFMLWRGDIETKYAVSFAAAESAFYLGLYAVAWLPRRLPAGVPSAERPGFAACVFASSAALHVAATSAMWAIAGIPLFRVSRLGAFVGSGGLGVVERLIDSAGGIALFTATYLLIGNAPARSGRHWPYHAFLVWFVISIALSGSKSGLLAVGQCVFAVAFLYTGLPRRHDSFWGGRAGKVFIVAATAFALVVLVIQQGENLAGALVGLGIRLVSFGDIYIHAYPSGAIESLQGSNPFVGLLGGFLSTFRLFPASDLYTHVGYQFTLLSAPDLDYVAGPNARHPVLGYHYFGPFAWLFSFALGGVTALLQRALYFPAQRHFLGSLFAYLMYIALVNLSADFDYALSRVANAVIALCLVLPPAFVLFARQPMAYLPKPAAGNP